ncbi:hypothetical protein TNCV_2998411 [Trichonephila clavipes]|nr:hypothetical protein TNCV_2998411 [Trichonephila clavipes]
MATPGSSFTPTPLGHEDNLEFTVIELHLLKRLRVTSKGLDAQLAIPRAKKFERDSTWELEEERRRNSHEKKRELRSLLLQSTWETTKDTTDTQLEMYKKN